MIDVVIVGGRVAGVRGKRGDATFVLEAQLVVGDDGASSLVRAHLGIPITLDTFPIDFVTALITCWPLPPHRVRIWIDPNRFRDGLPAAGFIPWPGNEGVLLVPLPADRAKRFFEEPAGIFWGALERITSIAGAMREQLEFPRDFRRVARPFGHAASYVADGAALIGDAAHPMSPAGDVSRERLLPYERLRRPINDRSISFSRVARRMFRIGRFLPLPFVLPLLARTINALGWPKRIIVGSFATAFVHPQERRE